MPPTSAASTPFRKLVRDDYLDFPSAWVANWSCGCKAAAGRKTHGDLPMCYWCGKGAPSGVRNLQREALARRKREPTQSRHNDRNQRHGDSRRRTREEKDEFKAAVDKEVAAKLRALDRGGDGTKPARADDSSSFSEVVTGRWRGGRGHGTEDEGGDQDDNNNTDTTDPSTELKNAEEHAADMEVAARAATAAFKERDSASLKAARDNAKARHEEAKAVVQKLRQAQREPDDRLAYTHGKIKKVKLLQEKVFEKAKAAYVEMHAAQARWHDARAEHSKMDEQVAELEKQVEEIHASRAAKTPALPPKLADIKWDSYTASLLEIANNPVLDPELRKKVAELPRIEDIIASLRAVAEFQSDGLADIARKTNATTTAQTTPTPSPTPQSTLLPQPPDKQEGGGGGGGGGGGEGGQAVEAKDGGQTDVRADGTNTNDDAKMEQAETGGLPQEFSIADGDEDGPAAKRRQLDLSKQNILFGKH